MFIKTYNNVGNHHVSIYNLGKINLDIVLLNKREKFKKQSVQTSKKVFSSFYFYFYFCLLGGLITVILQ